MNNKSFVKCPVNFSGNKYKLLDQIIPLFPKKIDRFIDACGGSFTVGCNIQADEIIYNEIDTKVFNLIKYLATCDYNIENLKIKNIISEFNLSKNNKEGFQALRGRYNSSHDNVLLYVLSAYSFNYQIRFNNSGDFNMAYGNRSYSVNMENNFKLFNNVCKNKNISFVNKDFKELCVNKTDFIYVDPPYSQTIATYTERALWTETKERGMYCWLDKLSNNNIRWALSNTSIYRDNVNIMLLEWAKKYNIHFLDFNYKNNNRFYKNNKLQTKEILITNYK